MDAKGSSIVRGVAVAAIALSTFFPQLSAWGDPLGAAPDPSAAVDAPSAKVDAIGGSFDGKGGAVTSGSVTLPVGEQFGVQLDGSAGRTDGGARGGMGGHFFYRDPNRFLLGPTVMWSNVNGNAIQRYGAEGEYYFDRVTLSSLDGLQHWDYRHDAYYSVGGGYYATDNLKFSVGAGGFGNVHWGQAGTEWQPWAGAMSLFSTFGDSNRGKPTFFVGIRYAFGAPDTSLKYRERHEDPPNIVDFTDNTSNAGIQSEYNQQHSGTVVCPALFMLVHGACVPLEP